LQEELFCIANHSAASQLFGDRISAPCPRHAVAPRRAQKRPPRTYTGCVFNRNPAGTFGTLYLYTLASGLMQRLQLQSFNSCMYFKIYTKCSWLGVIPTYVVTPRLPALIVLLSSRVF
jgi:hypothetical protein